MLVSQISTIKGDRSRETEGVITTDWLMEKQRLRGKEYMRTMKASKINRLLVLEWVSWKKRVAFGIGYYK